MAERKMADALDQLYKDGVKMEVQKAKENLTTELNSKLATKAPLNSPALTGTPTAPTPAANDNSTKIATTAYVLKLLKNNPGIIDEILTALGNKADKSELAEKITNGSSEFWLGAKGNYANGVTFSFSSQYKDLLVFTQGAEINLQCQSTDLRIKPDGVFVDGKKVLTE